MKLFDRFRKPPIVMQAAPAPEIIYRNLYLQATWDRTKNAWYRFVPTDVNEEFENNIENLRSLSHRLSVEDVYTKRFLSSINTNVIGPKGIMFSPQNRRGKVLSAGLNESVNRELIRAKKLFDRAPTVSRKQTNVEFVGTVLRTIAEDGECFINIVIDKELNETGLAYEVLDASLLDIRFNGKNQGRRIIQGIELDKFDRPVAYWFWNKHINSRRAAGNRKRIPIPALDLTKPGVQGGILHVHCQTNDRANALRGKPWVTPAMNFLARLQEYMDAELLAAQLGASAPIFLTSDPKDPTPYVRDPIVNTSAAINATPATGQEQRKKAPLRQTIQFEAGTFVKLAPGEVPVAPDVRRPNAQLEATVKQYVRGAAAALDLAYPTLANDNSDETFASARMSVLIERDHWVKLQGWYAGACLQPLFEAWLRAAMLSGTIQLPTKNPDDYMDIEWRGRRWMWVDPLRDAKSKAAQIEMGVTTITEVAEELGKDIDAVIAERKEEIAKFEKAEIPIALNNVIGMDSADTNVTQEPPDGSRPADDE
ncbi:hypothetical protein LCGC14_1033030 [marine sediment metagenome]|uniref:Phage portal protein, lambda family n=1 Tax=marine sediment metagenome TaxID=412755 RepID=A0A0F9MU33_9ZZZZ